MALNSISGVNEKGVAHLAVGGEGESGTSGSKSSYTESSWRLHDGKGSYNRIEDPVT